MPDTKDDRQAEALATWKKLVIQRLTPQPGDILLITSPSKAKRQKAGDLVEDLLESLDIRPDVLVICAPPDTSLQEISKRIDLHRTET